MDVLLPSISALFSLEFWQERGIKNWFEMCLKPGQITVYRSKKRKKRARGNVNYLEPNFAIGSIFRGDSVQDRGKNLREY